MAEQSSSGKLSARSLFCNALLSVVLRVLRPLLTRCDGSFDVLFWDGLLGVAAWVAFWIMAINFLQ